MNEDDDSNPPTAAKELKPEQSKWIKDNLTAGRDFSFVMAVGEDARPHVWHDRPSGTTRRTSRKVTMESVPGYGARDAKPLRGAASQCIVYTIGGRRIVFCW